MQLTGDAHAFMSEAIGASAQALAAGNMPFGAVLVSGQGERLWVAQNNQFTHHDCTGHAEMVLVRDVAASLGADALQGATVYASGEPCAMCCGAMFWAGIRQVVYAASQADITRLLGSPALPISSRDVLAQATPAVTVQGPFLGEEACAVLRRLNREDA